jgi:hypothetical protein
VRLDAAVSMTGSLRSGSTPLALSHRAGHLLSERIVVAVEWWSKPANETTLRFNVVHTIEVARNMDKETRRPEPNRLRETLMITQARSQIVGLADVERAIPHTGPSCERVHGADTARTVPETVDPEAVFGIDTIEFIEGGET